MGSKPWRPHILGAVTSRHVAWPHTPNRKLCPSRRREITVASLSFVQRTTSPPVHEYNISIPSIQTQEITELVKDIYTPHFTLSNDSPPTHQLLYFLSLSIGMLILWAKFWTLEMLILRDWGSSYYNRRIILHMLNYLSIGLLRPIIGSVSYFLWFKTYSCVYMGFLGILDAQIQQLWSVGIKFSWALGCQQWPENTKGKANIKNQAVQISALTNHVSPGRHRRSLPVWPSSCISFPNRLLLDNPQDIPNKMKRASNQDLVRYHETNISAPSVKAARQIIETHKIMVLESWKKKIGNEQICNIRRTISRSYTH
jgi:hypothetical protein